jgi:putative CocE/NonD family hydrolase
MYGFSYQGLVQYAAASTRPPHLFAICPAMSGTDFKNHFIFRNDILKLYDSLLWGLQLDSIRARKSGNCKLYNTIYLLTRSFSTTDLRLHDFEWLKNLNPDSLFLEWIDHRDDQDYWVKRTIDLKNISVPVLTISGWFDTYTEGAINSALKLYDSNSFSQELLIGPWSHLNWHNIQLASSVYNQNEDDLRVDIYQIDWLCKLLNQSNLSNNFQVTCYCLSDNYFVKEMTQVKTHDKILWPSRSDASSQSVGLLSETCQLSLDSDFLVHDPWRPAPSSVRGMASSSYGGDRYLADLRSDVFVYDSFPLENDLVIFGAPILYLQISSSTKTADLHCCVSSVSSSNVVIPFASGCLRSNSNQNNHLFILDFISIKIIKSHRIRLSISCSAFPLYELNTGDTFCTRANTPAEYKTITIQLMYGSSTYVTLPIIEDYN